MFLILLMVIIASANCDTKIWMYDTDIGDPKNWVDGRIQEECDGLVFAEYSEGPVFIKNLRIKQLVLPSSGSVRLEEGASVLFDEESTDDLNCVKLNAFNQMWVFNSSLWKNVDNPDNPAVPLSERPPCKYDDVVLPKGFNSSISFINAEISVKSVTFGDEKLTQEELNDILDSTVGQEVFPNWQWATQSETKFFTIKGEECMDPTGCDRRIHFDENRNYLIISSNVPTSNEVQCSDDIEIMGNFQQPICGAQIVINNLKTGFTIEKINKKLKDYASYTHASKYDPRNQIQIIFAEKEFTGLSLVEATEFYNILQQDDSYFCGDITLRTSGPPLYEKSAVAKNAVSIIFGTLLGVILMFGLLFIAYSPAVANLNLRNRLLSSRPLSTYVLHYDNIDDRASIIDGQSMAGSVLALNRSFENPLYEEGPSTRSTSNETVILPKLEVEESLGSEKVAVLDSAQELEDIDLHNEEPSKKHDVLLQDL